MDFEECKRWYDGYSFQNAKSIYNPNSVVEAMFTHEYSSYWTKTDTYEVLRNYISLNFEGLKDDIIQMLAGKTIRINPDKFTNDMVTFNSKDDVMTLLVHLGYLAYDSTTGKVRIPNQEIAGEFANAVEDQKNWGEITKAIYNSDRFLDAILEEDTDFICKQLERVHADSSSILTCNNENSLACSINLAFYTSFKYYSKFRELDSGKGFTDMVFLPRPCCSYSALLIELKFNSDAETAIKQIKKKRYTGRLSNYLDNLIMVSINYDKTTKQHTCIIETAKSC